MNTCPLCRHAMRLWALDARFNGASDEVRRICIATAVSFREECHHTREDFARRYDQLTAKLQAVMRDKSLHLTPTDLYEISAPVRREIEQIKNWARGGLLPQWQGNGEAINTQASTLNQQAA